MNAVEEIIDREVVQLVGDIISNCFEVSGGETSDDNWRLMMLGEISGVIDLGRNLKVVFSDIPKDRQTMIVTEVEGLDADQ